MYRFGEALPGLDDVMFTGGGGIGQAGERQHRAFADEVDERVRLLSNGKPSPPSSLKSRSASTRSRSRSDTGREKAFCFVLGSAHPAGAMDAEALAAKLGTTSHLSPLLLKAQRCDSRACCAAGFSVSSAQFMIWIAPS